MKLSARNIIKGVVVSVTRGSTTAHVKIDVGGARYGFTAPTSPGR